MAEVRGFHGVRYDPGKVDLSAAVAPPYDVIPDERVPDWQGRSRYNISWLTRPGADYAVAGRRFREWLAEGVLAEEAEPVAYLHEQEVGDGRSRRGILAALRLEPYESGAVLPHERTHRGPKEDRLALYRATGAAFEPLWLLYEGSEQTRELLASAGGEPGLELTGPEGERNRLWHLRESGDRLTRAFAELALLIADGHHRYETALAYADEVGAGPDHASRFALVLLVDIADPGLIVLPTHRVMRHAPVKVTGGEPQPSLEATLAAIEGKVAAGYYAGGQFSVIPLEGDLALTELHRQVIDNLLGKRTPEEVLLYTRDAAEAVRWVDEGSGEAAFFLPPPDLSAVLKLARQGKTLPQKSTYFFPKPPSGLVLLRLDRDEL